MKNLLLATTILASVPLTAGQQQSAPTLKKTPIRRSKQDAKKYNLECLEAAREKRRARKATEIAQIVCGKNNGPDQKELDRRDLKAFGAEFNMTKGAAWDLEHQRSMVQPAIRGQMPKPTRPRRGTRHSAKSV